MLVDLPHKQHYRDFFELKAHDPRQGFKSAHARKPRAPVK